MAIHTQINPKRIPKIIGHMSVDSEIFRQSGVPKLKAFDLEDPNWSRTVQKTSVTFNSEELMVKFCVPTRNLLLTVHSYSTYYQIMHLEFILIQSLN